MGLARMFMLSGEMACDSGSFQGDLDSSPDVGEEGSFLSMIGSRYNGKDDLSETISCHLYGEK